MSSLAKRPRSSTKHQQEKVTCFCQKCWDRSAGHGIRIPKYTARRHAAQSPRQSTSVSLPAPLDPRYIAQPFGRPQVIPAASPGPETATEPNREAPDPSLGSGAQDNPGVVYGDSRFQEAFGLDDDFDGLYAGEDNEESIQEDRQEDDSNTPVVHNVGTMHLSADIPVEHAGTYNPIPLNDTSLPAQDMLSNYDDSRLWKSIILLVVWLNAVFQLPYRACDLVLRYLSIVIYAHDTDNNERIISLNSAFRRLRLNDPILALPMCPNPGEAKLSLRLPYNPLSQQVASLLKRRGIEEAIDEWRSRKRTPGILLDIMDGEVWKTIPGPDGRPFFENGHDRANKDELRIGIALGFDGFGYQQSRNSATYSSDVLSCSIANLPIQLKCLTRNLLILCIYPGPRSPDCEQTQRILKRTVDELIELFEDGVWIKTYLYPEGESSMHIPYSYHYECNGRLVRVVLIAVCCDHPALCRLVGFADHNHEKRFCTKCIIPHADLRTADGLRKGYQARTGNEHRRLAFEYLKANRQEKESIFHEHGVRYTELVRLRYFDAVRMAVIDPMHNILLGIMKSQWHDSLIKTDSLRKRTEPGHLLRELDLFNLYLKEFEMLSWVGRLPSDVGYPAAGSLSADEYKAMALVYLPVILPFVWAEWQPIAQDEYERKLTSWKKREEARLRRLRVGKSVRKDDETPIPQPTLRMNADEANNYLDLAAALKIFLARSVLLADIPRADFFLDTYLQKYLTMHPLDVKPNFHWVVHVSDQIRDYGPVYGLWSFTYERLNKLLKGYSTNNHGGGEIEMTFMRTHVRDTRIRDIVRTAIQDPQLELQIPATLLLKTDSDNRGTVAGIAQELDEAAQEAGLRFSLGMGIRRALPVELQSALVMFYHLQHPDARVLERSADVEPGTRKLNLPC